MNHDTHIGRKQFKILQHPVYQLYIVVSFMIAKKFWTTKTKEDHAWDSTWFMQAKNWSSLINFLIWGPSNTPAFFFTILNPGKASQMYQKLSPFLSKALKIASFGLTLCVEEGKLCLTCLQEAKLSHSSVQHLRKLSLFFWRKVRNHKCFLFLKREE